MTKMHLHVGIDDLGTGTGKTKGFAFVTMPEAHVPEFEAKASDLLKKLKKPFFHAKEFGAEKRTPAFVQFLVLFRDFALKSLQVRAAVCLFDASQMAAIGKESQAVLNAVAKETGLSSQEYGRTVVDEAMHLASNAITIANHTEWMGPEITMSVELAAGPKAKRVGMTSCVIDGKTWDASSLLQETMNRIIAKKSNNSPGFTASPVAVVSAKDSLLVQAADVFGNFFLFYLKQRLGATSGGVVEKAEIVKNVFAKLLGDPSPLTGLSWNEKDDLCVAPDSLLTIKLRPFLTKAPTGKALSDYPGASLPAPTNGESKVGGDT
jgi:hypothetical protein